MYRIFLWDHTWNLNMHYSLDHRIHRWMWDLPSLSHNFTTEADRITLLDRVASIASASFPLHRGHKRSTNTHRSAVGEVISASEELKLWAGDRCWWGGDRGGAARARPEGLRTVQPCVSGAKVGGTRRLARFPLRRAAAGRWPEVLEPPTGRTMTSTYSIFAWNWEGKRSEFR